MIVVDASALVELLLGTKAGVGVRKRLAGAQVVHTPELVDAEVLHVLRRWLHRDMISGAVAEQAVAELGEFPITRHGHSVLRDRAWALRERCSAYDAMYVALSEALGAELLTGDARLARAVGDLVEVHAI